MTKLDIKKNGNEKQITTINMLSTLTLLLKKNNILILCIYFLVKKTNYKVQQV